MHVQRAQYGGKLEKFVGESLWLVGLIFSSSAAPAPSDLLLTPQAKLLSPPAPLALLMVRVLQTRGNLRVHLTDKGGITPPS